MGDRRAIHTPPGFLTGSPPRGTQSPIAVTGSLERTVTVGAVAQGVSVAGVAAVAWASGRAVLERSSGVASLQSFGVSRDLSLDDLVGSDQ